MIKYALLFIGLLIGPLTFGQTEEERVLEQIRDQEQAKNAQLMRLMDQGVDSMTVGNYTAAAQLFKKVIKGTKVIPTDLCFYFGKNSYYLGQYQQSIDWLNKYIEIKGTKGRFYEETKNLLNLANKGFLEVRAANREEAQNIISSSNYEIDCGPTGKVICPVCRGEGVIIERGAFGNTYRNCPYSDEHGYLTCAQYNQLLRGELKANNQ